MRGLVFEAVNIWRSRFVAPFYRSIGKKLYAAGTQIEAQNASEDRLVPSLRRLNYSGNQPQIDAAEFVAPNATILGDVTMGFNSSVWYGATIIGTKSISIGENCVIQDRAHLSNGVRIGNDVFIGPNSIVQGAQLHDWAYISMGSTVRHATVESGGLVAAGAVIGDNIIIKEGEIWAGNPGKFLRNITAVEREILREHVEEMRELALIHAEETEKSSREVISGKKEPYERSSIEDFMEELYENPHPKVDYTDTDEQFLERRTFMREDMTLPDLGKDYEPYEYNVSHMGEKFNLGVHNEDLRKVATKIKQKQAFEKDTDPWRQPF